MHDTHKLLLLNVTLRQLVNSRSIVFVIHFRVISSIKLDSMCAPIHSIYTIMSLIHNTVTKNKRIICCWHTKKTIRNLCQSKSLFISDFISKWYWQSFGIEAKLDLYDLCAHSFFSYYSQPNFQDHQLPESRKYIVLYYAECVFFKYLRWILEESFQFQLFLRCLGLKHLTLFLFMDDAHK